MQTFLPQHSFAASALVLDRQRLGKQRIEVRQMLQALAGETKAWANHPCTNMWRGSEMYLCAYGFCICEEWVSRGYKDQQHAIIDKYFSMFYDTSCKYPPWLGDESFHDRHKSRLLQKNYEYYSTFGWGVPRDLEYEWWCPDKGFFIIRDKDRLYRGKDYE